MSIFSKKKNSSTNYSNELVRYEPSIADFLKNDFNSTIQGIKGTVLRLIEKEIIRIEKKVVNLGTPWEPDEVNIIQLSLTANADPDSLSRSEDFMIRWLMFTYGDGVHTNVTKVLDDLENEEFISANNEMFRLWKNSVIKYANSLDLYSNKPSTHGLNQSKLYKKLDNTDTIYNKINIEKEEIKSLLSIFDQSL